MIVHSPITLDNKEGYSTRITFFRNSQIFDIMKEISNAKEAIIRLNYTNDIYEDINLTYNERKWMGEMLDLFDKMWKSHMDKSSKSEAIE